MTVTVAYTGGFNPFGDGSEPVDVAITRFADKVRAAKPGITDFGVSIIVKRAVSMMKPRLKGRTVPILGRDIMSERVQDEPFWSLLGDRTRQQILQHPIVGGDTIQPSMDAITKAMLMARRDRHNVNRSVLITRHGDREMSRTYVWRESTNWEQEMADEDWAILLDYRQLRTLFLRTDTGALWKPVIPYSHIPVLESEVARTTQEAAALRKHFTRSNHHQGVDV